jgi:hypothetical protein
MRMMTRIWKRFGWLILMNAFLSCSGKAQIENLPPGDNVLENAEKGLPAFRARIDSLKACKRKKIRIVHIGDSHIQPDKFTGEIRTELQTRYGDGGRGFLFPYTAAKTNGPRDYTCSTCTDWVRCRNVDYAHKIPLGLAGMVIQSQEDSGSFSMHMGYDSLPLHFSKATLFFSSPPGTEVVLNKTRIVRTGVNGKHLFDTLTCSSFMPERDITVCFQNGNLCLHGLYVENETPGIVYSAIGVAGARFIDFCQTDYFFEQLQLLNADVIVVSLGTNESYNSHYTDENFITTTTLFLSKLRKACPHAEVILTCPSENYYLDKKQPVPNLKVEKVNRILRKIALDNNYAIWDLYKAMGGKGSMKAWKKEGLVNPDYVHFLKGGYKLQGELFSKALIDYLEH